MESKNPFTPIDQILKKSLKDLQLEETFQVYPIWKNWSSLLGVTIASKSQPDYMMGKTLVVSVENSVWMNELQLQKNKLLEKINQLALDSPIADIRFRLKTEVS